MIEELIKVNCEVEVNLKNVMLKSNVSSNKNEIKALKDKIEELQNKIEELKNE